MSDHFSVALKLSIHETVLAAVRNYLLPQPRLIKMLADNRETAVSVSEYLLTDEDVEQIIATYVEGKTLDFVGAPSDSTTARQMATELNRDWPCEDTYSVFSVAISEITLQPEITLS